LPTSSLLFCLLLSLVLLLKYMLPLSFVATYFTTYLCCYCCVCFEVVVIWYYHLPIFANMGVRCYVLSNYCSSHILHSPPSHGKFSNILPCEKLCVLGFFEIWNYIKHNIQHAFFCIMKKQEKMNEFLIYF
jgi:hypothetical protein